MEAAKALVCASFVLCGDFSEHRADGFACVGEHACGSRAEVPGNEGCHDVIHFSWRRNGLLVLFFVTFLNFFRCYFCNFLDLLYLQLFL